MHLPLIAVTGSNGKTTVTQMIAAILRAWHPNAMLATAGNLNNHIGVPLTLLRLRQDDQTWHRAAVLELGMNHPGEIALLARLAAPTVALVNNAQREHQEFMASVEAVARENGSVIQALGAGGTAVFPADDAYAPLWRTLAGEHKVLTFATGSAADVTASASWRADSASWDLTLHTPAGRAETALTRPAATTCTTRWRPPRRRWPPVRRWPRWRRVWRASCPWPGARRRWRCDWAGAR